MDSKIVHLQEILGKSNYTVALCGSGMMEESGFIGIKKPERAYEIECVYGASPEEIFTSAYYNTRPAKFFEFYKKEILEKIPEPSPSSHIMAAMERKGHLQCIITSNIFEQEKRGGCENVIDLHGTIYMNRCPHCGEYYSVEDIMGEKGVPRCRICNSVIRPLVSLFGEMVDSRIMTRTTEEIGKAEVLLLLGTTLNSDVFSHYIRYFSGKHLILIHKAEHYMDNKADLVIIDEPGNVLCQIGY